MSKPTWKQRLALVVPVIAATAVPLLAAPSASAAESPQSGNVTFEVTGSGTAITIDTDPPGPPGQERQYNVSLPWHGEFTVPAGVDMLQVVAVGGDNPGCRIVLDGRVVAQQPPGGSAHCIYDATAAGR
jgi:hypothetical protein